MLFGPKYRAFRSTAEFDYTLGQVRNPLIMKDIKHRATLLRWVAEYIVEQGPKPTCITTHTEPIVKASLSFPAKFL